MTDLPALLDELADDAPQADLVPGRWSEARRRRRRTTMAAAAGAVGAVVLAVALIPGVSDPSSTGPSPTDPADSAPARVSAVLDGHPAFVAPTLVEEGTLAAAQEGEVRIDLSTIAGTAADLDRATYAFAAPGSGKPLLVWLVDDRGGVYPLDVPVEYGMAVDENGTLPFLRTSLTPSGRELMLITRDGYALYDVDDATWREPPSSRDWDPAAYRTSGWSPEDPRTDHPFPVVDGLWFTNQGPVDSALLADVWGPPRVNSAGRAAQAGFADDIEGFGAQTNPEVVVVDGVRPTSLVIPWEDGRFKGCCAVAGWLDSDRVIYESRQLDRMRLLAWDTRDGSVSRLADVTGLPEGGVVGSYADLGSTMETYPQEVSYRAAASAQAWLTDQGDLTVAVEWIVVDYTEVNVVVSNSGSGPVGPETWEGLADALTLRGRGISGTIPVATVKIVVPGQDCSYVTAREVQPGTCEVVLSTQGGSTLGPFSVVTPAR